MGITETFRRHPDLVNCTLDDVIDDFWNKAMIGLTLVDRNDRFVHPNPLLCKLLNIQRPKLEKMTWREVTIWDDRQEDAEAVAAVIRGDLPEYQMHKTYMPNLPPPEDRMPAWLRVFPIHTIEGDFAVFVSQIARDDKGRLLPAKDPRLVILDYLSDHKKEAVAATIAWTSLCIIAGDPIRQWLISLIS